MYARMVRSGQPDYRDRAHFMGVAAQAMRKILISATPARGTRRSAAVAGTRSL